MGNCKRRRGVKAFCLATKLPVHETGLWLQSAAFLCASPDRLVGDDAVLEVKCPFTQWNSTKAEAVASSDFCLEKLDQSVVYCLKQTHPYWHQVQGQMYITGRSLCYFVIWTTKETAVITIKRDPAW